MIVGLLVIALACLAIGIALPSVAWLIASLIATAGAAYLLLKARSTILAPAVPAEQARVAGLDSAQGSTPDAAGAMTTTDQAATTARAAESATSATGAPANASRAAAPGHITENPTSSGFATISIPSVSDGDVWVIDGRPRYHRGDCAIIQGQDAEPIPFQQATEDGFMPCSLCEPNAVRTER